MNAAKQLIKRLWENYKAKVPTARQVEEQLKLKNETWVEDHIALRSFNFDQFGSHNFPLC